MIKKTVILFILIGMAYVVVREVMEKSEFQFSDNVTVVGSKDCEGTQWIKQQECSINGKTMDGTEGSCGPGKEIWILDPDHKDFKRATGDGKCESQERDCSVECPKPCEGDTWKNTGRCVRREYDIRNNIKEIVLDGTEGKCGEGITELNLDTTAPDYKPAVGKGECPMTKGGVCNVPCPEPEPPKCNAFAGGWVKNTGLGCVVRENSKINVNCGQKGKRMEYMVATDSDNCEDLVQWIDCWGDPCPIDCVGSWSGWSAPTSDQPCDAQPYKEKTYTIRTKNQHGGKVCDYTHEATDRVNVGSITPCCEESGVWTPGSCNNKGIAIHTQSVTENKPGGCPDSAKSKKVECCYPKNDWWDITKCNSVGKKTQRQNTVGVCGASVKTREVGCCFKDGPWYNTGGATCDNGKYQQTRYHVGDNCDTVSSTRNVDCCKGEWQLVRHYLDETKQYCQRSDGTTWKVGPQGTCPWPSTLKREYGCKALEEFVITDRGAGLGNLTCEKEGNRRHSINAPMGKCDGKRYEMRFLPWNCTQSWCDDV